MYQAPCLSGRVLLLGCAALALGNQDAESDDSELLDGEMKDDLPVFQELSAVEDVAWDELPVFQVTIQSTAAKCASVDGLTVQGLTELSEGNRLHEASTTLGTDVLVDQQSREGDVRESLPVLRQLDKIATERVPPESRALRCVRIAEAMSHHYLGDAFVQPESMGREGDGTPWPSGGPSEQRCVH